jgi:hypothetical protein
MLRSVSLSDRKTLGSLTERQRGTLVRALGNTEPKYSPAAMNPIVRRDQQ